MFLGRISTGNMNTPNTNTTRKIGNKTPHNHSSSSGYTPVKGKSRSNQNNPMTPISLLAKTNLESFKSPEPSIKARHPVTPTKMIRTTANTHNIDNETLKDLIIELINYGKIKLVDKINRNKTLNNLFSKYKLGESNTLQPILQTIALRSNFTIPKIENMILLASGAYANVYIVRNKPYVLKKFKRQTSNNGIETNLLPEFYGCLMNANLNLSLSAEYKEYFNEILQMYAIKELNNIGTPKINLISILEKCDGDLITFLENLNSTDINELCKIFNQLCKDCAMILCLLKRQNMVHRDIKPDNILYIKYPNGEFKFKLADYSTMIAHGAETKDRIGTNAYIGPKDVFEQQSARLKRSERLKRIKNIENLKKSIKLDTFKNKNKLEKLEELEESGKLDIGIITARVNFLSDFYSMALTELRLATHIFNISIRFNNFFPFTYNQNTFHDKYEMCSNIEKYNKQVEILNLCKNHIFQQLSNNQELTEHSKIILERDLNMIVRLFLSNNPSIETKAMETFIYQEIETYLTENGLTPPHDPTK